MPGRLATMPPPLLLLLLCQALLLVPLSWRDAKCVAYTLQDSIHKRTQSVDDAPIVQHHNHRGCSR
jgi:maltodextrin utilization protein YvdJ